MTALIYVANKWVTKNKTHCFLAVFLIAKHKKPSKNNRNIKRYFWTYEYVLEPAHGYGYSTVAAVPWQQSTCLRDMGSHPCKAEPDIWMQQNGDIYEYIGIYVDDISAAAKDPKAITDLLQEKYQIMLKHTCPISFHLGCDFIRDEDGTMCMPPGST